ncbi:MAG: hypothetical protein ACE14Q_07485 [Acidobacteriota bacterium]
MRKLSNVLMVVLSLVLFSSLLIAATCNPNCCLKAKDVKITATNIEKGVEITYSSENPEAVKMIQEKLASCAETKACKICGMKGVKRVVKNTETGAVMTLTAKKEAKIKELQETVKNEMAENAANTPHKGCSKEQQRKCGVIK